MTVTTSESDAGVVQGALGWTVSVSVTVPAVISAGLGL